MYHWRIDSSEAPKTGQFELPRLLVDAAARQGRSEWLEGLPSLVSSLAEEWHLDLGPPFQPGGTTSYVAPARRGGDDVVLKVLWPHVEAEHEFDALALWQGDGAVQLHDVSEGDDFIAAVLERCSPGSPLTALPELHQDAVLAGLLKRLWRPVPSGSCFRPLSAMCDEWAEEYESRDPALRERLDPGIAREGIALFRHLATPAPTDVLILTDLHAENILSAGREPWLVVDPKPHLGDPHYDVLQHMLNCRRRLHEDPARLASRMASLTGLDAGRVRAWLFARCVQESPLWPGLDEVATRLARGDIAVS